jgi:hypothetical protein
MQPDCINDLRMKEATAKSAMNSEYFRTARMTYNCCYYYSYELETAIPLRATPFAAGSLTPFKERSSSDSSSKRDRDHPIVYE